MFKIAQKKTVMWPVNVRIPQDGGRTLPAQIGVQFEILTMEEQSKAVQEGKDLLEVQIVGWDARVKGEDDQPLEYSPEAKEHLLDILYVRQALFEALGEINSGRAAARKN